MWKEAKWTNGKRTVKGRWIYSRASEKFNIELDARDSITGAQTKNFSVYGDEPEWGKFRRVTSDTQVSEAVE